MPRDGAAASRQRPVSCFFCRSRKLRCSRTQPCTNCTTRGIPCRSDNATSAAAPAVPERDPVLLDVLERLRQVEQVVAKQDAVCSAAAAAATANGAAGIADPMLAQSNLHTVLSPRLRHLNEDVAWLERLSMGQNLEPMSIVPNQDPAKIIFKIVLIREMSQVPAYIMQLQDPTSAAAPEPTRCVPLPQYHKAKILVEKYMNNLSFIQHVVHHPSLLPATVDEVYLRLNSYQDPAWLGHVVLLLSLIAGGTYGWTDYDCDGRLPLFSSCSDAYSQTEPWIKAALDVLNAAQSSACLSLELIQGLIIILFILSNQGISLRYRSLLSTALVMGRELGLHWCDHPNNLKINQINPVRIEMGRRVWWYLVSTDWLMAAHSYGPTEGLYQSNPHHMIVKKPINIDDEDLYDSGHWVEKPISQPTDMSFFLQRIRLAEICRNIADRQLLTSGKPILYADIIAVDAELECFIRSLPPFLNMCPSSHHSPTTDTCEPTPSKPGITVQAHILNSLVYTQRCKLHLPFLTGRSSGSMSATAYSREVCLSSAKVIIQIEVQLERENHPFVLSRLKVSGILYGVFMASIVLLMDVCVAASQQHEMPDRRELLEAFRILENASKYSATASNFLDSLMHVLRKHQVPEPHGHAVASTAGAHDDARQGGVGSMPLPHEGNGSGVLDGGSGNATAFDGPDCPLVVVGGGGGSGLLPSHIDELVQGFEMVDGFQWDDIFSGIDSFF
ncbi:hypothetical protein B0T22DRAFT_405289 [Podospora appendiculata]|uniref:Zn(2)-C6 fungal-type domain-containing protein n=1 Tax=Podospora appendiculata TaxID=314037 RepID=A0AAE1CBI9_9PEZI|nr:hypothetical protein B0T22DRAFT_405289 [Podospora appendiculata]